MTPPTLGPAVTSRLVRAVDSDRRLLRLYVAPRFYMGVAPKQLSAWAGIPSAVNQPVIVALEQWREGARERLGWPAWEAGGAGSGHQVAEPVSAGPVDQLLVAKTQAGLTSGWTTPSSDLTFNMLNVSRDRWQEILGSDEDPDAALARLTDQLRDDLVATIADIAFTALENQQRMVRLTEEKAGHGRRFTDDFLRELVRILPIHPYATEESLRDLCHELLQQVRQEPLQASWGRLNESDGDLVICLRQPAEERAGADAPAGP